MQRMTAEQVADFLADYNKWRRGDDGYDMPSPKILGEVIEDAVWHLGTLKEYHAALSEAQKTILRMYK